ncbi:MAG: helix-turn-helix transcriptional regulator [Planctomycetaceae bacterium]
MPAKNGQRADAVILERLTRYLLWLENSRTGLTVDDIRRRDEIGEKTVRRVLSEMERCGWVESAPRPSEHNKKYWTIKKPPQIEFAHDELLSLYLGQQMMQPLSGTPLCAGFRNLMTKVKANQPRAVEELAEVFLKHFQIVPFGQCDYSEKTELLSELIHAVNNNREITIVYQSLKSEKPKTYPVHPYAFFYHRGALYIVAYRPDTEETKHLKLNRLFSVAETGKAFKRPSTWNLADSRSKSFGVFTSSGKPQVVSIQFVGWAASHVKEATWHSSQEITMHDDGSLTLKMIVTDLTEVQTWVLGFGPEATVLEPKILIDKVRKAAAGISRLYAEQP